GRAAPGPRWSGPRRDSPMSRTPAGPRAVRRRSPAAAGRRVRPSAGSPGGPPPATRRWREGDRWCLDSLVRLGRAQPGLQVRAQVVDVLQAHGQPDEAGGDPAGELLFGGELAVRGAGRVDDEAAHVTDVDELAEQLGAVHEGASGVDAAAQLEGDDRARALGQVLL